MGSGNLTTDQISTGRVRGSRRTSAGLGAGALLLAFLLLTGSAITLNLNFAALTKSRTLVLLSNTILWRMAEVQEEVRAAETGQRGYIITGERRYLAPYERATEQVWSDLQELEGIVQDREQQEKLQQLRPLLQAKLDELAQTVALRSQSFEAAVEVVRTDVGQKLMEDIQAVAEAFRNRERRLLDERTARLEADVAWTTRVAGLTGLLAVLSAVLGVIWLARQRSQARLLVAERRFRAELEQQVQDRTTELVEVNRELDAFAYTISHDLRAPLRAMHGFADALLEDFGSTLPKEGQRFVSRIRAAALRMDALISDILTYSRLAREEVSLRPVALEAAVDQVLANMAPLIEETRATISVAHPLPAVNAHRPTLVQAIENLLTNAIKFVAPGTRADVRITAEQRDDFVRLTIDDNGIGLDPAQHERVFQPFQRLHGVEAYPGTGIGLAIVRRSMDRMGGSCGVDPKPGGGSRFWIELQAAKEMP